MESKNSQVPVLQLPGLQLPGPQTTLAIQNWGEGQTPRAVIRAYALVKLAALSAAREADTEAGRASWSAEVWERMQVVLDQIILGEHDKHFLLGLAQGGAGTSLHMNLNEVLAALVGGIDAIADCNRYQSTNDTFSTAATIIAYEGLVEIEAQVIALQEAIVVREKEWAEIVLVGRSELQDALPITLGQVCASWAGPFERDRWRLARLRERVRSIALGGTALGTGFGAPIDYVFRAEKKIRSLCGLPLARSQNLVDEISHLDKYSELAGAYKQLAENIVHLCQDLLYYTSSAVAELGHPRMQAASSQMPAKNNPVALEYACGLAISVQGEAHKISQWVQLGRLQLNPYLPFVLESIMNMVSLLSKALNMLSGRCIPGLLVRKERIEELLLSSPALLNALAPQLGYEALAQLAPLLAINKLHDFEALKVLLKTHLNLTNLDLDALLNPSELSNGRRQF